MFSFLNILEFFKNPKKLIKGIIGIFFILIILGLYLKFKINEDKYQTEIKKLNTYIVNLEVKNNNLKVKNKLLNDKIKNLKFENNVSIQKEKLKRKFNLIDRSSDKVLIKIKNTSDEANDTSKSIKIKDISKLKTGDYSLTIP